MVFLMMFIRIRCYNNGKLQQVWKFLIDNLIELLGITTALVFKLVKRQTDVLCKICKALKCDYKDIMEDIEV